jgi:hypothetical protein
MQLYRLSKKTKRNRLPMNQNAYLNISILIILRWFTDINGKTLVPLINLTKTA